MSLFNPNASANFNNASLVMDRLAPSPADPIQRQIDSLMLKKHYRDRYEKAVPDAAMQTQAAKLPNELVAKILQYRSTDAVEKLKQAEISLHGRLLREWLPQDQIMQNMDRGLPDPQLTLKELIAYNDSLDEFHLATRMGASDIPAAERGKLMHDALRQKTPRLYKKLSEEKQKDTHLAFHHRDGQGFNLLSKAILTQHRGAADKLVEQGLDVLQKDITGQTPVEWAALMGETGLVDKMLATTKDRMLPTEQDRLKVLSQADDVPEPQREELEKIADEGKLDDSAVKKLGAIAADIDHADIKNRLQLIATRRAKTDLQGLANRQKLVKVILKGETQIRPDRSPIGFNFQNSNTMPPTALKHELLQGMASLAAGRDFHPQVKHVYGSNTLSPFGKLLDQCRPGARPEVLQAAHALIQSGVDVNQYANYFTSPLSENRHPEILDALLEAGADPNGFHESLLLHHLTRTIPPDKAFFRKLINAGAEINAENTFKNSPLLAASLQDDPEYAMLLLEHGADPNLGETHGLGHKPIHWASDNNHAELVETLIRKGAPVDVQNAYAHHTPLHIAASKGNLETARVLLRHEADAHTLLNRRDKTPRDLAEFELKRKTLAAVKEPSPQNILAATRYRAILKAMDAQKRPEPEPVPSQPQAATEAGEGSAVHASTQRISELLKRIKR